MTIRNSTSGCALVFAALAAWSVGAQEGPAPTTPSAPEAPLWLISCSNQANPSVLTCEFSQSIVLTQGNQRVATASFVKDAGQPEMTGVFTLPVGVHLPAGLTLSVDDAEMAQVPFRYCDAQSCRAEAEIEEGWMDILRSGSELTLGVERADRQPVNFAFQLEGFSETEALLP